MECPHMSDQGELKRGCFKANIKLMKSLQAEESFKDSVLFYTATYQRNIDKAKAEFPKSFSWDGETLTFHKGTTEQPAPLLQVMEVAVWFKKWFGE
jgi:hypothetical protein